MRLDASVGVCDASRCVIHAQNITLHGCHGVQKSLRCAIPAFTGERRAVPVVTDARLMQVRFLLPPHIYHFPRQG
jgi:hypothetical protein